MDVPSEELQEQLGRFVAFPHKWSIDRHEGDLGPYQYGIEEEACDDDQEFKHQGDLSLSQYITHEVVSYCSLCRHHRL
jgi:hypothetical protein